MHLRLSDEQELLRDTFAELFAAESSPDRVRAAEPTGFDPALWKTLVETGVPGMRVPEERGGTEVSLLEAALLAEQVGRHLASGPVLETVCAGALLGRLGSPASMEILDPALDGGTVVTLALRALPAGEAQLVPGGAVADVVVGLDGEDLVAVSRSVALDPAANLAALPVASWCLSEGERVVLARGADATNAYAIALEEWKLLTAAALGGLAHRALEIAAEYATERLQFDRPIGAFQAIAHPLADSVADVEAAQLLVWHAIWAIATGRPDAAARVSMAFAWAADVTSPAVARSLHTHGGYGLSLEYDIQLYHRRGKAWALLGGRPQDELERVAARRWEGAAVPLPPAGDIGIEFGLGEAAEIFRGVVRDFLEENLTDELRAHAHFSWDGHHEGFQKQLAEAGLLFPSWPAKYGGQDRDPYETTAFGQELQRVGWGTHAIMTTQMVAETLMHHGSEELKLDILPRISGGEVVCSLGYSEPASGSDVAAAQTRAVRDGDEWVINGQKMFTSGANVATHVFLLTLTDPEQRKRHGLTMFLVPFDTPGVEIQPIHTLSDERTNATYYTDVRIPDAYRVGEVDGGWAVLGYALHLEHGGGGGENHDHAKLVASAVDWARATTRNGRPAYEDPRIREGLARAATRCAASEVLSLRSLFCGVVGEPDLGQGPMVKLFSAEAYIRDASDLMDLTAPDSILSAEAGAVHGGEIEFGYRLSQAMSIYGGTSEIMRSIVGQVTLGMPRSRS